MLAVSSRSVVLPSSDEGHGSRCFSELKYWRLLRILASFSVAVMYRYNHNVTLDGTRDRRRRGEVLSRRAEDSGFERSAFKKGVGFERWRYISRGPCTRSGLVVCTPRYIVDKEAALVRVVGE